MTDTARIEITSGPDRGKTFDLSGDLTHIGRGGQNQVLLTDPQVDEHQASIVTRQGRYAIYTPREGAIQVDGNALPADQWVWLPGEARIQLSPRTSVRFVAGNGAAAEVQQAPPPPGAESGSPPGGEDAPRSRKSAGRKKGRRSRKAAREKKGGRQVAEFVTDQSGDSLVKLGEDGHLPELHLEEGQPKKKAGEPRQKQESSPALLYGALAVSLLMSVGLLFVDLSPSSVSQSEEALAVQRVKEFVGTEGTEPEPYQEHLRAALRARARGDEADERRHFRRVLALLNAADNDPLTGLTGRGSDEDERLRRNIGILLSR